MISSRVNRFATSSIDSRKRLVTMKHNIPSVLVIIFILWSCFQDPKAIRFTYDKFTDISTARSQDLKLEGKSLGQLSVRAGATFKGKTPASTPQFSLHFINYETDGTPARYGTAKVIHFLLDGEKRLEIPVKYERTTGGPFVLEQADIAIASEDVQAFAKAKTIELRWGKTEMKLSDEGLAVLLEFVLALMPKN